MLQNSVSIPPLSEPEARTYINLLYAELYATPQQFALLRDAASENRAKNQLAVAMNEGIARSVIGDLSDELAEALAVAERIGSPLARGLRGNPRQIKRFLNRLRLRQQAADRRTLGLDPAKLAKLMVLEALHVGDFEQLFHWQLEADGVPPQLRVAEALARDEKPQEPLPEAEGWLVQPGIREWLLLEPRLSGEVLGPYYTFSRDRLKKTVSAARLPAELQRLLVGLQSDLEPTREKAVADVAQMQRPQLAELLAPLVQASTDDLSVGGVTDPRELVRRLWPIEEIAARYGIPQDRIAKLDGNENLYGPCQAAIDAVGRTPFERYPDPDQRALRAALAQLSGITDLIDEGAE